MAAADHIHPQGSKLSYDADGANAYTDLADIISFTPPPFARGRSDDTRLEQTDKVRDSSAGWSDPGESSFTVYMTSAQFNTLLTMYNAGASWYWKVTYPLILAQANNATLVWQGYLSGSEPAEISKDGDDKIAASFRIQGRTHATFTPAS